MKKLIFLCGLLISVFCTPEINAQQRGFPRMYMQINNKIYSVILEDSITVQEFLNRLPLTLNMTELNGNEKYHYLDQPLTALPENIGFIESGDLLLWNDDCLVLFYEKVYTPYTYTRIGKIENPFDLAIELGHDDVNITFIR